MASVLRALAVASLLTVAMPGTVTAWDAGNPLSQCIYDPCSGGVKQASLGFIGVFADLGRSRVADCPPTYTNNGLTCGRSSENISAPSRVANCPTGFKNMGLTCFNVSTLESRSSAAMTCDDGYFVNRELGRCYKVCDPGYTNTGEFCRRPVSTLSMSSMTCRSDERLDSGRCFPVPSVALRGNTHLWIVLQALQLLRASSDPVARTAVARLADNANCRAKWQAGLYRGDEPDYADGPSNNSTRGTHFYNGAGRDAAGNQTSARTYLAAGIDVTRNADGSYSPNARQKAELRIASAAKLLSDDDACSELGFALHYMTDMTQPMHATSFSGLSLPLMLHPYFEAYVPVVQASIPATGAWNEGWKGQSADATFHAVAIQSSRLAPALLSALIGSGKQCSLDGIDIGGPYSGPCFINEPTVDAQIRTVLQAGYQFTASYIYNVFSALGGAPTPTTDWTLCATEGGVCTFSGTRQVRYGADGRYAFREATGSIGCNNEVFGDPIVGVVKQCWYSTTVSGGPSLTPVAPSNGQQPIRLRPGTSRNGFLKFFPADGNLAIDMDREAGDATNPISHWWLEPMPETDWFHIRHVGTGQYLTSGPAGVRLTTERQDPSTGMDTWTLVGTPYSFSTGDVTLYRIRNRLSGQYFSGASMQLHEPGAITDWARFEWNFMTPEGRNAPDDVAMTGLQIADMQRRQTQQTQREQALEIARSQQGCWLEKNNVQWPLEQFVILRVTIDTLIVQQLEYDGGSSREAGAGWYLGQSRRTYRWENGVFSDGFGSSLAFRDDGSAWRRRPNIETSLHRLPLPPGFPRAYSDLKLSEDQCNQLVQQMPR